MCAIRPPFLFAPSPPPEEESHALISRPRNLKLSLNFLRPKMWRKNNKFMVQENQDSDQSISEEEDDLYDNVPGDCISLGGSEVKKGRIEVLSQLEILRDSHELEQATSPAIISQTRETGISIQDEVCIPVVNNQGDFACLPRKAYTCSSDEEIISDDEIEENNRLPIQSISLRHEITNKGSFPGFGITRKDEECAWSAATREVEALVHPNENAACSSSRTGFSKANRSCKGVRGKMKPRFSFQFQSHKEDVSWDVNDTCLSSKAMSVLEESESIEQRIVQRSMSDVTEFFQGRKVEQSDIHAVQNEVSVGQDHTKHSMAEILDSFQENKRLVRGNSKVFSKAKGRTPKFVVKKSISPLEDRNMDYDAQTPEKLDSEQSSDDEDDHHNLKLIIPESKQKTMADHFQEAFCAASMRDEGILFALPKHSGTGLFGKLQRVMQNEKEREIDFTKRLQAQTSLKGSYFDVRILSKSLEAKLTVCSCSLIQQKESSEWVDNHQIERKIGGTTIIIFSSRLCSDIELEVGNLIRIHPPWKDVRIMVKDEIVILSTYFSQIST